MDSKSVDMGSQANNSSDFVRKLYKMLEDPTYDKIVRWGEGGQSFVVLENEKFTKFVLPKHFKHSNFASFVRQLNKYDFHKVRQNNEDNTPSPYGNNAWEFKHPEFQANKKDSLDNIRRKAPNVKKPAQNTDDSFPAQQMDFINGQLVATQQQLQTATDKYNELAAGHTYLLQQFVQLQKFVKNQDNVLHRVVGFLQASDAQRRSSRIGFGGMAESEPAEVVDDHLASPLQQAAKLLDQFSNQSLSTTELEQKVHEFQNLNDYSTPPQDAGNAGISTQTDGGAAHLGYNVNNDLDNMVYPVGHTNGIDPIHHEHIHNIPYALPPTGMIPVDALPDMMAEGASSAGRKKSVAESVWGPQKPKILLVEDDKVCARIGCKFLQAFECGVDTARDGLEAVNKINSAVVQYDLILMDIIMPHLDGVSATVCIREQRPQIPIIAMTSNIRADDIDMYFRYGMNDVLPKPFTKEGMLRALEKHLPSFRKSPQPFLPQLQMQSHSGYATPNSAQPPLGLSIGQISGAASIKDETSPGKSPATIGSWNSPNQLPGQSPLGNPPGGYMQQSMGGPSQYTMTPTMTPSHPHQQQHHLPQPQGPYQNPPLTPGLGGGPRGVIGHRRVMSDMTGGPPADDHPDKRQRLYGQPGNYQQ